MSGTAAGWEPPEWLTRAIEKSKAQDPNELLTVTLSRAEIEALRFVITNVLYGDDEGPSLPVMAKRSPELATNLRRVDLHIDWAFKDKEVISESTDEC